MARIKFSGLVTEIKGSIGGTTFQGNAYGFTVKNKANMVRPNTQIQQTRKTEFLKVVNAWGQLTQAQRDYIDGWAVTHPMYSHNNPDVQLTGFSIFVKSWVARRMMFPDSPIIYFAAAEEPPAVDSVTASLSSAAGVLTITTNWALGTGAWAYGYSLSPVIKPSQQFPQSIMRYMGTGLSENDSGPIQVKYTAAFGAIPVAGDIVLFKYFLLHENSYYSTSPIILRITVT
jgi:hypothetical protein